MADQADRPGEQPVAAPSDRDEIVRAALERHLDDAYRTATWILGDSAWAEDAVGEALIRAWSGRAGLRDPATAERWFLRILVNACRSEMRRRDRHPTVALTDSILLLAPDAAWYSADRDELGRALERLTADERVILALRYGRELSVAEVADRLAIPVGTAKSRLHYALRNLRAVLDADRRETEEAG